ncbi:hypothetical protein PIB30_057293 [Stylosanthes scabra]|uniref:RNase H type-1 domain-containing protein n=1 Tax=Stylosanthes scabra TaxID=79078 RepID=A0ABU6VIZ3_9FABA|nr:hypothetical protein [Stylosanthes scabra]
MDDLWLLEKVMALIRYSESEMHKIFFLQENSISFLVVLKWNPPTICDVKVNCDASRLDHDGAIDFGCGELFAIWRGLLLAWDGGYREVFCETDCYEAFILVKESSSTSDALAKYAVQHGIQHVEWLIPKDDFRLLLMNDLDH